MAENVTGAEKPQNGGRNNNRNHRKKRYNGPKNGGNNNNSNDKPGKRWKRGGTGSTARTGDTIRLGLFITIFAVAVLGLIVLLVKRSRRKDESS